MAYAPQASAIEDGSAEAIAADILVVRPLCFAMTIIGSALFVVALPVAAISKSTTKRPTLSSCAPLARPSLDLGKYDRFGAVTPAGSVLRVDAAAFTICDWALLVAGQRIDSLLDSRQTRPPVRLPKLNAGPSGTIRFGLKSLRESCSNGVDMVEVHRFGDSRQLV